MPSWSHADFGKLTRRLVRGATAVLAACTLCGGIDCSVFGLRPALAQRQPQVQLEIAVDPRLPPTTQQEWMRRLAAAGIERMRLRTGLPDDRPEIRSLGGDPPDYAVRAVIDSANELSVPGAKFRPTEAERFKKWLDELLEKGPPDSRPRQTPLGIDIIRFQMLHQDLARPVTFSTSNRPRSEVFSALVKMTKFAVIADPVVENKIGDDPVTAELQGFALGTAMAYLLRSKGLALVPRADAAATTLVVLPARKGMAAWPVGWPPEGPETESQPKLLEFLTVDISNSPITEVVQAISRRIDLPYLWDDVALARFGLRPEESLVNVPQTKTTHYRLLKQTLFQAKLRGEIRLDEAGRAFLWITSRTPLETN
ncbi:MAG: hypothetical protein GYA33_08500 [Thermogutta sp.]|nr:hypothetical protein [Thermogutta sp.]